MKKNTTYVVSGETNTKPTDLPSWVKVTESTTKNPHPDFKIFSEGGNLIELADMEHSGGTPRIQLVVSGYNDAKTRYISVESARLMGEWLLEVAESHNPKLRKFQDRDGSTFNYWYEVAPDKFTYDSSRECAVRYIGRHPDCAWTYEKLNSEYGPLTLIEE